MIDKIKGIIFILLLGGLAAGLLSFVDKSFGAKIEENKEVALKRNVILAAGLRAGEDRDEIRKIFSANIRVMKKDAYTYYVSPDGTYIFEIKGPGLWGPIEGVMALGADIKTIKSLRIIFQEETPGLGGRIAEEDFLKKFSGKTVDPRIKMVKMKKATLSNEVDAITGATMTSNALEKIINSGVEEFLKHIKETM